MFREDRSMENMTGSSVPMMPMVRPSMTTPTAPDGMMGLYPRPSPFFDALPSSVDEARRVAVDNDQSLSKSMGWITANAILSPWEGGLENEIFNGQFVFAAALDQEGESPESHREVMKTYIPALTLRHVNEFLRVGYQVIHRAFQNGTIRTEFNDDELQILADTPVRNWHRLDFVKERVESSPAESLVRQIMFLSEQMVLKRFNPYGWIDGQVPGEGRLKQVAIRRHGTMEDVENLWSNDMQPGDNLFFILRRNFDAGKGEWGPLAYVPWYGPHEPSLADRTYTDYTGHIEVGCATKVGSLDRYTQADGLRVGDLQQLIGIERCTLPRVKIGPEPGCLRITSVGSKNRLPWLF